MESRVNRINALRDGIEPVFLGVEDVDPSIRESYHAYVH